MATDDEPIWKKAQRPPGNRYPLILASAMTTRFIHSQGRSISMLRKLAPEPYVEVNQATAEDLVVADGERVVLSTAKGPARMKVFITSKV